MSIIKEEKNTKIKQIAQTLQLSDQINLIGKEFRFNVNNKNEISITKLME